MKLKGISLATLILVLVVFCILRNHSGFPQATYAERKILSVPFIEQGPNLCSEASASMVLLYYGINISQEEINAMGFDRFEKMLPLLDKHVHCEYKSLSVGGLVEELKEGHPVIIRLKVGFSLHTVVAVGYEDSWIIVHDPASGPCVLLRVEEPFISSWAATSYSSIVVYGHKP
ncbi:MAG: C39 family peptidase [Thermoproteota archaeon]